MPNHPSRRPPLFETLAPADRLIAAQGFLLIVFSSWAFGGRVTWAPPIMFALALLGTVAVAMRRQEGIVISRWIFVPFALWTLLAVVGVLNPSYERALAGGWIPRPDYIRWLPSTVDVELTFHAQLPWLTAILQATVLAAVQPERTVVRFLWGTVALNAFVLAAVGAAFHFSGATEMLGTFEVPASYFFATFYYKNHWAAFGALGAIAGTALALRAARQALHGNPRERGRVAVFTLSALLTLITLPLPGSRSGVLFGSLIVSLFLGAMLSLIWSSTGLSMSRRWRVTVIMGVVIAAIIIYGVNGYASRQEDWERTTLQFTKAKQGKPVDMRLLLSRDTLHLAMKRPVFGWGVGSFPAVFPAFQGKELRGPKGEPLARPEFAHNDWLQMVADSGFVGLGLLLLPLLLTAAKAWRGSHIATKFALMGLGMIALYGWVDFPFNNPAIIVIWVTLLFTARQFGMRTVQT